MKIYNAKYRVKVVLDYEIHQWLVKYRRKGWFKFWQVLHEADALGSPYYTEPQFDMIPVSTRFLSQAREIARHIPTEAMLNAWIKKERKRMAAFWDQKNTP